LSCDIFVPFIVLFSWRSSKVIIGENNRAPDIYMGSALITFVSSEISFEDKFWYHGE